MQTSTLTSLEAFLGLPEFIGYIFAFIIGACIGSFLNVVIYRVPNELSLLTGSKCPNCQASIRFYHNVPIFGWLMLGGKCISCKEPIAWRYPAIELLTAVVFLVTYWQIGLTPFLLVGLVFVSAMIALIFIDADHMILPDKITIPMIVGALIVRIVYPIAFTGNYFLDTTIWPISALHGYPAWMVSLAAALLGAIAGGGTLWFFGSAWKVLFGREGMGFGDVKMMFGVGALLGWRLSLLTIFLSGFAGALIGLGMILASRITGGKHEGLQMQLAYGVFLGIGSIVALLFGDRMLAWYVSQYG